MLYNCCWSAIVIQIVVVIDYTYKIKILKFG
jgi:hypothetical protein